MFKRDWNGELAPWIMACFGLALTALVAATFFYSKGHQAAVERHQADIAARNAAQQHYEECATKPTIDQALECYQRAEKATRQDQRAEHDLNAQREMADWAEGMLWATLFVGVMTTFVTGIGVIYVALTLREARATTRAAVDGAQAARTANAIAAEQFRSGYKPWLRVDMIGPYLDNPHQGAVPEPGQRILAEIRCAVRLTCISEMSAFIEEYHIRTLPRAECGYTPPTRYGSQRMVRDLFIELGRGETVVVAPEIGPRPLVDDPRFPQDPRWTLDQYVVTQENCSQFHMYPPPIAGRIVYSDPIGVRRELCFAFVPENTWDARFKRFGGREFNYERELQR